MNDQRNIKVGQERGTDLLIAMAVGRSLFANTYTVGKASEQKIMSICGHENRILQSEENRPSDGCSSTLTSRSYTEHSQVAVR